MEVMGNQYIRVKKNYGIDEALAESSESEADEYIRRFAYPLIWTFRWVDKDQGSYD